MRENLASSADTISELFFNKASGTLFSFARPQVKQVNDASGMKIWRVPRKTRGVYITLPREYNILEYSEN